MLSAESSLRKIWIAPFYACSWLCGYFVLPY